MPSPDAAKLKAQATYNAAADTYDDPVLAFWDVAARGTLTRADLRPGQRVLDACCGSGSTAIPAAELVGPDGSVIGVDLAENLLALAGAKARERGLANLRLELADMTVLDYPDEHFDAVLCQLAIFFVPDMEGQIAELWRMVRPGGRVVMATFGPRVMAPVYQVWWDAVEAERPGLVPQWNPWDRITDPASMRRAMLDGGTSEPIVEAEDNLIPIPSPDDWWKMALGSGLRWAIDQLDPESVERVRRTTVDWVRRNRIDAIEWNLIYSAAVKAEA